ncbi:hypothetical protein [Micromonospora coerulea]|uniref:hypothetical protein n=1 Tax=Micromonospora coerulea TaxID=47856 RepID=UPI0031F962D8
MRRREAHGGPSPPRSPSSQGPRQSGETNSPDRGEPSARPREANTAQLLAYAALTGVDGWLAPSWLDVGADLLVAAGRRVDRYGGVTGVSGAPDFERPGTSPEPQAFHLLAHAALAQAAVSSAR